MPPGTLSARYGLPATILSRSLLTFCFFGADAFVTLAITILRHRSPVVAGVAVTGSTLAWTAGAWIQARMSSRWEGKRLVRIGLAVILTGIAGLTGDAQERCRHRGRHRRLDDRGSRNGPVLRADHAADAQAGAAGREGWASASLNLADVLGSAMGIGIGGAAISAAVRFGWSLSAGLAAAFAITATAGIVALAISHRLPAGLRDPGAPAERGEATRDSTAERGEATRDSTAERGEATRDSTAERAQVAHDRWLSPPHGRSEPRRRWSPGPGRQAQAAPAGRAARRCSTPSASPSAAASTTTGRRLRCAIGEIPPVT